MSKINDGRDVTTDVSMSDAEFSAWVRTLDPKQRLRELTKRDITKNEARYKRRQEE